VSEAREALERSLEAAAAEHEAERESLEARVAQLKEAAEAGASRIDSAELDAVRSEFLSRLGKVEGERDQLARLRDQAAAEWDAEKAELAGAVKEARGQQAADAEKFEGELKEKLTLEFRIKDLELEKERLEARIAATANPGSGSLGMMLDEEITTVDRKIAEIARFIDDPESPLSSVIRKNVERSELEAYRRGLDFRLEMVRKSGSE
jgi:hypothetical protein